MTATTDTLIGYVLAHTERGACTCGKCCDAPPNPSERQPEGHTADLVFFQVARRGEPDAETFRERVRAHRGEFCEVDPFDGKEHSFMELGGWIGDQGLALQTMGLGALLGVWSLLTPNNLLPFLPEEMRRSLAGSGMVTILATPVEKEAPDHAPRD